MKKIWLLLTLVVPAAVFATNVFAAGNPCAQAFGPDPNSWAPPPCNAEFTGFTPFIFKTNYSQDRPDCDALRNFWLTSVDYDQKKRSDKLYCLCCW